MSAADVIWTRHAGRVFKATRRTAAHIEWTIEQLQADHPNASLRIIQTCYNTGVSASAGTHDFDAAFDVEIVGLDWWTAQGWLRAHGWAAWVRQPPVFSWHIHMVSLGYPGRVGIFVPGQVSDYYNHRSGLSGHVADNTWHPADIDSTIFDYPAFLRSKEDQVTPEDIDKIADKVADRLLEKLAQDSSRLRNLIRMVRSLGNQAGLRPDRPKK
jgi:hypothetical protein